MNTRPASTIRLSTLFFKALIARCATMVIKFMRIPTKSLVALIGAAGALGAANGQAISVSQVEPTEIAGDYYIESTVTNNSGVNFEFLGLDYSQLLFDVANLDYNVSRFDLNDDNVVDFGTDNLVSQLSPYLAFSVLGTGDVSNGWSGNIGSDGIVDITNNGGIEGVTYDAFSTSSDMDTRLILDYFLVENPNTSTIVPMSLSDTETITDFATGVKDSLNSYTDDGQSINVVPEPSQYAALAGALALGLAAYRRPTRKE